MLILRRKSGESIAIGQDITITVLDLNEGSVRLAIDAPKSVTILRSELLQAADVNRDAAELSPALARLLEREAKRPIRGKRSARVVKPVKQVNPADAVNPFGSLSLSDPAGNLPENSIGDKSGDKSGDKNDA